MVLKPFAGQPAKRYLSRRARRTVVGWNRTERQPRHETNLVGVIGAQLTVKLSKTRSDAGFPSA